MSIRAWNSENRLSRTTASLEAIAEGRQPAPGVGRDLLGQAELKEGSIAGRERARNVGFAGIRRRHWVSVLVAVLEPRAGCAGLLLVVAAGCRLGEWPRRSVAPALDRAVAGPRTGQAALLGGVGAFDVVRQFPPLSPLSVRSPLPSP